MNRCAVRFAQQALSECALAWRQRRLASGVVASAAQVAQRDAALWQAQQVRGEPSGRVAASWWWWGGTLVG